MSDRRHKSVRPALLRVMLAAGVVVAAVAAGSSVAAAADASSRLDRIKHVVVIYEENHSFDNLYGGWEGVRGRGAADAAHTTQVSQTGTAYQCLEQDDVNLTSPPLSATCTDTSTGTPSRATSRTSRSAAAPPSRASGFCTGSATWCTSTGGEGWKDSRAVLDPIRVVPLSQKTGSSPTPGRTGCWPITCRPLRARALGDGARGEGPLDQTRALLVS